MPARILIIEDNKASMDLLVLLLKSYGHVALQASDGEQGLALAREAVPDLILCDIHIPKMDGHELLRHAKDEPALRHIPVIAVTALAMAGDCEKLLSEGFDGYLSKPIEPETFIGQIEQFLPADKCSSGYTRSAESREILDVPSTQATGARILVVDDNPVNRELLRATLVPAGYEVKIAGSVSEGLENARAAAFDLILSDIHMPERDGFHFVQAIKEDPLLCQIPFMFVSASSEDDQDVQRATAFGATFFFCRPIEPQALLGYVETCLKAQPHRRTDGNNTDR